MPILYESLCPFPGTYLRYQAPLARPVFRITERGGSLIRERLSIRSVTFQNVSIDQQETVVRMRGRARVFRCTISESHFGHFCLAQRSQAPMVSICLTFIRQKF